MTDAKNQQNREDFNWRRTKSLCERGTCSHLLPDENMNCVNECTSSKCFKEIYEESPLEDGEIDQRRSIEFVKCLRIEEKENRISKRRSSRSRTKS